MEVETIKQKTRATYGYLVARKSPWAWA